MMPRVIPGASGRGGPPRAPASDLGPTGEGYARPALMQKQNSDTEMLIITRVTISHADARSVGSACHLQSKII